MKFRTLLLGTAAAFAVSGGAQAADLAIAVEPIDYVKICDAFGVGYWYIPGTDTCLAIGGRVRTEVFIYDDDRVGNYFNVAQYLTGSTDDPNQPLSDESGGVAGYLYAKDDYAQNWNLQTNALVTFNTRSMSDLGVIATNVELTVDSNNNDLNGSTKAVRFDGGYGQIGPILFGYTGSTFDPGGGYTYSTAGRSDQTVDQIRFTYLAGTWGIFLGLEDPRDRYGGAPSNATGNYPDIVLAVTGGVGGLDVRAAVAVTDRTSGTGWGANLAATAKLGVVDVKGSIAYSDNAKSYTGGDNCPNTFSGGTWNGCDDGQWWGGFLSAGVFLSSNFKAVGTISYQDGISGQVNTAGGTTWGGAVGLRYYPTSRTEIGGDLLYSDPAGGDGQWGGRARFEVKFN